jgi:hypothetical protein
VTTTVEHEFRVSPRVVLRSGDTFKATQGPYWKTGGGERISMADRGVFTFVYLLRRGRCEFILGAGKAGFAVLHVAGRRRSKLIPNMVCRPYRITAKRKVRV